MEEEDEEEFSKLKFLKLSSMLLRSWNASSNNQFGCLEKLELSGCWNLKEIPSCVESIPMLRMMEVNDCDKTVGELVNKVKEVQMVEYGNSDLKHAPVAESYARIFFRNAVAAGEIYHFRIGREVV
ncbi:OLC1v1031772C1 [Oldenlandia corymbosa var. corymbosa]|uniref:OLC1v1031772C1 n=1 Tax=Oldenlandia corymbosa var. corymbosa TaxID=529605 RepID=A0AAV1CK31_OLDCO|nr:OLC1v1031772C1 [Oldenlandia corymbosa var. corymbosa]